jgi:hypothetical protein
MADLKTSPTDVEYSREYGVIEALISWYFAFEVAENGDEAEQYSQHSEDVPWGSFA